MANQWCPTWPRCACIVRGQRKDCGYDQKSTKPKSKRKPTKASQHWNKVNK